MVKVGADALAVFFETGPVRREVHAWVVNGYANVAAVAAYVRTLRQGDPGVGVLVRPHKEGREVTLGDRRGGGIPRVQEVRGQPVVSSPKYVVRQLNAHTFARRDRESEGSRENTRRFLPGVDTSVEGDHDWSGGSVVHVRRGGLLLGGGGGGGEGGGWPGTRVLGGGGGHARLARRARVDFLSSAARCGGRGGPRLTAGGGTAGRGRASEGGTRA